MLEIVAAYGALWQSAPASAALIAALPIFLISAAASDAYRFIIPDWTSLGLLLTWPIAWALSPLGWDDLWPHLAVFIIALVVSVLLFELGVWGGGDAKLMPCALLWLGWPGALHALLITAYAGVVLIGVALLWATARRLMGPSASLSADGAPDETDAPPSETEGVARHTHTPYGVAIAAGALYCAALSPVIAGLAPDLTAALR